MRVIGMRALSKQKIAVVIRSLGVHVLFFDCHCDAENHKAMIKSDKQIFTPGDTKTIMNSARWSGVKSFSF